MTTPTTRPFRRALVRAPAPASTPLRGLRVAVVDVETTGLDPVAHDVVAIAVAHVELGSTVRPRLVYSSLHHPARGHRPDATAVHGLHNRHTRGCPSLLPGVPSGAWRYLAGRTIAAYHAPFDAGFLRLDATSMLDPALWVEATYGRRRKLQSVARQLDIPHTPHDASSDALAAAQLLSWWWDDVSLPGGAEGTCATLEEVLAWQAEWRAAREPAGAAL